MPNRIIKDSIAKSEKMNELTDFQFRLWVHLITYVDDYGRGDARPAIIRGSCFPLRDRLTNKDIEKGLADLAGAGCVSLYKVDGKPYLYFPNWEQHQRVRQKVSKCPAPEDCDTENSCAASCGELPRNAARIQNPESRIRIQNPESECIADMDVGSARKRFAPPSVAEVRAYCTERNNSVDAQRFVDYYSANGWMVGKNRMRDWKAAVRTWERQERPNSRQISPKSSNPFLEMLEEGYE